MNNAQLIQQDSGNFEYYTPSFIIEAARAAMGGIELDPASSEKANETVRARHIYTLHADGLTRDWFGRVWLNHPFGKVANRDWIGMLISEYIEQHITQACCITFACTSERWFRPLFQFPMCFLAPRTNYLTPDGKVKTGVTKGSVVTYLGKDIDAFKRNFSPLGHIVGRI